MRALPFVLLALAACSAYDTDLGPTPYNCGETEPVCPDGYSCQDDITTGEQVCVANGNTLSTDFDCVDDSALEPNNALDTATATPVDSMKMYEKGDLSICPAGDKDVFSITTAVQNEALEITVEFGANGAPLVAALLNKGGVPIRTAEPVTGDPVRVRLMTGSLPADQYYVQVAANLSGMFTLNNYKLTINVTGP